jgi:hypothetical protein
MASKDVLYIPAMEKIDLRQPIQPRQLTGIHLNQAGEPVVQMQILGTLPFKFLLEKADADSLRRIASMATAELEKRGERF